MHNFEMVRLSGREAFKVNTGYDKVWLINTEVPLSIMGKLAFWFINFLFRHELLVKREETK